jgi:hypothetical protein
MNETGPVDGGAAPVMSEAALLDLARARSWALVAGAAGVVPAIILVVAGLVAVVAGRRGGDLGYTLGLWIGRLILLLVPILPAVLTLLYARNLGRFARGDRPALAAAFRNLRALWAISALGYGLSLLFSLGAFRN